MCTLRLSAHVSSALLLSVYIEFLQGRHHHSSCTKQIPPLQTCIPLVSSLQSRSNTQLLDSGMGGAEQTKLRILCLHGYRQTGTTFREKTGAFRKLLKKHAEFVFVTSPVRVPPLTPGSDGGDKDDGGCGWWFSQPNDYFKAQDESECVKGYNDSLKAVVDFVNENGPFDGLLGFSQGGAMLGLLCGLQQQGNLPFSFKFAIFASAFKSRSSPHQALYSEKITLPTLHVFGEEDQVIQKHMSDEFLQYFHEPQTLVHPGGHFIPATGAQKATYVTFLEKMAQLT